MRDALFPEAAATSCKVTVQVEARNTNAQDAARYVTQEIIILLHQVSK